MRILLTNDDGITSDGLWAAARGLSRVGHLTVIGTEDDWSNGSASVRRTIGARLARFTDVPSDVSADVDAYAVDASPGGAILIGMFSGLFEPFDLVVSGANWGVNVGGDLLHSGTLGAAATGFQRGATAFGISQERGIYRGDPQRWDGLADVVERVARWMLGRAGSPILLNVNVPNLAYGEIDGAELVRPVGWSNAERVAYGAQSEEHGVWRVTADIDNEMQLPDEPGTDAGAIVAGRIAVTHVLPTGWRVPAGPDDLHDLIALLSQD
ncbi:MAG: 5'/3'-nucleotidase SurE [Chloroflexota bacterium]